MGEMPLHLCIISGSLLQYIWHVLQYTLMFFLTSFSTWMSCISELFYLRAQESRKEIRTVPKESTCAIPKDEMR